MDGDFRGIDFSAEPAFYQDYPALGALTDPHDEYLPSRGTGLCVEFLLFLFRLASGKSQGSGAG
jgi:hypothetical protein